MKIKFNHLLTMAAATLLAACSSGSPLGDEPGKDVRSDDSPQPVPTEEFTLCKGADVSWLTEMEAQGIKFYYDNGTEGDCMAILKSLGMNTFRFRVWVDPANKWCSTEDVIAKCRRAAELDMDVMVDFHYSDSWADPGKQDIPAAWKGQNLEQLIASVGSYTTDVLTQLKTAGVDVKYVQVGNETGNGMLWPYGQADKDAAGYAALTNAGYDAVKSVYPEAKVIVHLQDGQNADLFKWLFDLLKKNNARYDVIGMSLYPEKNNYASYVTRTIANMKKCIEAYDKDVMLVEVGMGNSYVQECKEFLTQCFDISKQIPDNRFLGVLYWEPQVYNDWQGYKKGAFTSQGRPSEALKAFSWSSTGIKEIRQ